nr:MAG TPA: hypothetical protein [Caudoviricetes sp.]
MNTSDKIINELAVQLANKSIENANYKVFYDEAQEKLVEVQTQLEQAQARLNEVSQTLEADEALKELFDEVAEKLEAEKLEKEK